MTRPFTAAFVVLLCCWTSGQEQFEVASVRKIEKDEGTRTITFAPERFEALLPLRTLILMAFDLRDYQVSGGPGWIHADLYQVLAKAPGKASNAEMRRMLQQLLAERFQLKVRRETKTASTYDLVVARSDGRFGPQFRKSDVDCAALGPNPPPVPPASKAWCGIRGTGPRRVTGQGATMMDFTRLLSSFAERLVIDETGLSDRYDFEFLWYPAPDAPWLGTALEDQLGLKLTSAQRQIEFLFIDQVQAPSPD